MAKKKVKKLTAKQKLEARKTKRKTGPSAKKRAEAREKLKQKRAMHKPAKKPDTVGGADGPLPPADDLPEDNSGDLHDDDDEGEGGPEE